MIITLTVALVAIAGACAASFFFGLTAGAWIAANMWKKAEGKTWRRLLPSEVKP